MLTAWQSTAMRVLHRVVHEGHQLLILALVEGERLHFGWFLIFLGALIILVGIQVLWPENAAAAAAAGAMAQVEEESV